jgi:hypothetical protein
MEFSLNILNNCPAQIALLHEADSLSVSGRSFYMEEEIWQDIPGHEGYFQVSNLCNFRSLYTWTWCGLFKRPKPFLLKPTGMKNWYPMISLGFKGFNNRDIYYVHRLIASIFIPNPFNLPEVNHVDGDKTNYKISNLEWSERLDNMHHAFITKLIPIRNGSKTSMAKLTEKEAFEIFNSTDLQDILALCYGVSTTVISSIKNGFTWNHVTGLPHRRKRKLNL